MLRHAQAERDEALALISSRNPHHRPSSLQLISTESPQPSDVVAPRTSPTDPPRLPARQRLIIIACLTATLWLLIAGLIVLCHHLI